MVLECYLGAESEACVLFSPTLAILVSFCRVKLCLFFNLNFVYDNVHVWINASTHEFPIPVVISLHFTADCLSKLLVPTWKSEPKVVL